ncbi:MAG: NADH dehydrogenase [ubiquinone] 1 alpha subcomplex assembly factor 1 [Maribacter sp.]|jgi:NADH dehydrogenase [ubiquinone] 1 alpha subcomplex assembly factor 1
MNIQLSYKINDNSLCEMESQLKYIFPFFLIIKSMTAQIIVDFKENPTTINWYVVDDVVMGGRSSGTFDLTDEGYGKFSGVVSLENNGGFSSVRYDIKTLAVSPNNTIRIRIKGDGNPYQFRVKDKRKQYYSYITTFETSGDWQTLEFRLKDFYPTFRGRELDLPNFNHDTIEELQFLIGNKKPQAFKLLIASIVLVD